MSQTVVGVFDNYEIAQDAQRALISSGFEASNVHVRMHEAHMSYRSHESDVPASDKKRRAVVGVADNLRDLLVHLFGSHHEDIDHYSEAVRRGHAVVAITVDDDALVPIAQSALRNAGALDIEKQVEGWRQDGYSGFDAAARPYTPEEVLADRAKIRPALEDNPDIAQQSEKTEEAESFPSRAYPFQLVQTPYDDIMGKSGGVNAGGPATEPTDTR
ncbi:hypothetical protein ACXX82_23050 [Glaciimonas sp. GNP009]